MTSTTYATVAHPAIGEALGELATATRHLLAAVTAKLSVGAVQAKRPASRAEEAAAARAMADRVRRFDPRMAADIYCAADRHESGG